MNIYLAQIAATLALLSQTLTMLPVTNLDGGGAGGAIYAPAVITAPSITGISPSSAYAGDTVTVYGTNFASGASVVFPKGTSAAVAASVLSGTQLTFVVPSTGMWGTQSLQVILKGSGAASNYSLLNMLAPTITATVSTAPTITSVSPSSANVGDTVTVYGSNFSSGASYILFPKAGGISAIPNVISSSQLSFVIPSGAESSGVFQVVTKGSGEASNLVTITIAAATPVVTTSLPKIIGLLPTTVKAGDTMSVYGSGLYGSALALDGAYGTQVTSATPAGDYVTFVVPSNFSAGTHTIRFDQKATMAQGNSMSFTVVTIGVPYVRVISPPSARPGDIITMTGTDINQLGSFTMDGIPLGTPKYVDPAGTYFTFVVPANASVGPHTIQVFQKATGAPGNQQQLIVMAASTATSTVGTPTITLFSAKDINPATNGTMLIWQASGVTDAQINFSCAAGSIQFANDKGTPLSCEKGGLGSWANVTNGSISVTPIGNTTSVTVPFTLSLTKNGYPTGQSQTESVTFPATARVPRPPAPVSTSTRPAPVVGDVDTQPAPSSCLNLSNSLRYRARDAQVNGEVSSLQDFLQSKGYLNSEPTGFMGLLTVQAAKQFQQDNGISPTGFIGEVTKAKIRQISCGR